MKNKKIIGLLVTFLMITLTISIKSYAVTLPELRITSNNYSVGYKMEYDDVYDVEVEKTLQLYAVIGRGNDMPSVDHDLDSLGWFVTEANLSGVTWTSSNTGVATVDNTGKVTGVAEGKTTITATYNGQSDNYEINVKPKSSSDFTGIVFIQKHLIPPPSMILNKKEQGFMIYLYNIPDTEKGNIKVSIDNESVAKLNDIDLCNWEDGSGKGMIIANAKFLSLGQAKITATLNYNGKSYSDSYTFSVRESAYSIIIQTKNSVELPEEIAIGDKLQLIAKLTLGSTVPIEITDKATWTSSDEKIVKVDNKGLVTAIREGTATITVKYKVGDETITATYNLKITGSTKTPVDPETTSNPSSKDSTSTKSDSPTSPKILPKTGENATIMIIGIILVLSTSMIMYKKYRNYKNIK